MIPLKIENLNHCNLNKGDDIVKDILKMSYKERTTYLNNIDVDKELAKATDYRTRIDNKMPISVSQLIRKNYKLFFGTNKEAKTVNEKFNYLLVILSVFNCLNLYDDFIKESEQ